MVYYYMDMGYACIWIWLLMLMLMYALFDRNDSPDSLNLNKSERIHADDSSLLLRLQKLSDFLLKWMLSPTTSQKPHISIDWKTARIVRLNQPTSHQYRCALSFSFSLVLTFRSKYHTIFHTERYFENKCASSAHAFQTERNRERQKAWACLSFKDFSSFSFFF